LYEDNDGIPGAELFSILQAAGHSDGWNEKDLSLQGLNISGDFWAGTKEFSSSKPFGLDTSSSGDSYQRVGSGSWTAIDGNLGIRIYLDCGDNCDDDGCANGAGDVNEDGMLNVLDIVQVANAILGGSGLSDCGLEAGDLNGDGMINILDIVQIANMILGGRSSVDDATTGSLIRSNNTMRLEANGYIGGVQMTLRHGSDFSIDLTNKSMLSEYNYSR
jgi:hypothetical protein